MSVLINALLKQKRNKKRKIVAGNIFLSKPFEIEELLKTIEDVLNDR